MTWSLWVLETKRLRIYFRDSHEHSKTHKHAKIVAEHGQMYLPTIHYDVLAWHIFERMQNFESDFF